MNYQLVIKIPVADASADAFDRLLVLENRLDLALRNEHKVDGHSIGNDAVHMLILTDSPREAFALARAVLTESGMETISAAYRDLKDGQFTVIWPEDYEGEFTI